MIPRRLRASVGNDLMSESRSFFPQRHEDTENNEGDRCPAERWNGKRDAENWLENPLVGLENLLVATSAAGKRKKAATENGGIREVALAETGEIW